MQKESKIKICHLTSVHRATDTRIYWKECLSLKDDYEVYLIAPAGTGLKEAAFKKGVRFIPIYKPESRIARFLITDFILLLNAIRVNARLYHFHDPELIPVAIILKMLGKKVIYDVHEDVVSDVMEKNWLPFKNMAGRVYKWFEKLAISYFYIVLAEKSYAHYFEARNARFVVVRNFVRTDMIVASNSFYHANSHSIALVGTLSARRGLPFILDAILLLQEKGILIKLVCIGAVNDAVKKILKDSKSFIQVKEQVEFLGYISFPVSSVHLKYCLAGLALPETLPNHMESYPTKMFEYMALGLPVICSDFPLYKEVVEKFDCGIVANPENPEAIASAIELLIENKETANRMSSNAKCAVNFFNWETESKVLLDFYKQILIKN